MSTPDKPEKPAPDMSRRKFLTYFGGAVLITASYRAFSVFGDQSDPTSSEISQQDDRGTGRCRYVCQGCITCMHATSLRG